MGRWVHILGFLIAGVAVAFGTSWFFDVTPRSTVGWIAISFLGIVLWLLLEWVGKYVLEAPWWSRLRSPFRVLLAVPVMLLLIAFATISVLVVRALAAQL
jgi:hypothetical protein